MSKGEHHLPQGPQHGPVWEVCSLMAIAAAVPVAAAPLSLTHASVPAAIYMLYVCLYNEPVLGGLGKKKVMFHMIDTLKLEAFKVL